VKNNKFFSLESTKMKSLPCIFKNVYNLISFVSTYSCDADRRKLKSKKSNLLNALRREKTWNKLSTFVLQHNSPFLFSLLLHIRNPFFSFLFAVIRNVGFVLRIKSAARTAI
jgi:hypothetical protein